MFGCLGYHASAVLHGSQGQYPLSDCGEGSIFRKGDWKLSTNYRCITLQFCGGKAGWNDRAIFIETDLKPVSKPDAAALWCSQIYGKAMPKCFALCPTRNPIEPSILYLPTYSNWSLWWVEGPSVQLTRKGVGLSPCLSPIND